MNNIPCIKCNAELFSYIKPSLYRWGYKNVCVTDDVWKGCPLLIINLDGNIGRCANVSLNFKDAHNRELVDDVEEFLYRAAQLKGFNYKKKNNMFTKKDLKTGMVVKTRNNTMLLVVDDKLISVSGFLRLTEYNDDLIITDEPDSNIQSGFDIMEVYEVNSWGLGFSRVLSYVEEKTFGKLIWKRKEIKEVTMQEIADKLGIPVENLRIKE